MSVKPGKYVNDLGATLEVVNQVVSPVGGYQTLGGIWEAFSESDIFGLEWFLVTKESLRERGYEFVPEGGVPNEFARADN